MNTCRSSQSSNEQLNQPAKPANCKNCMLKVWFGLPVILMVVCSAFITSDVLIRSIQEIAQNALSNREKMFSVSYLKQTKTIYELGLETREMLKPRQTKYPAQTNKLPYKLAQLIREARKLKIFIPPLIQKRMNRSHFSAKQPGIEYVHDPNQPAVLASIAEWHWVHDSYRAPSYMMRRLHHDPGMFTTNLSEADLCFVDCESGESFDPEPPASKSGYPRFAVAPGKGWKFSGCTELKMYFEVGPSKCWSPVPYFHSIYSPSPDAPTPWTASARRSTLVCFVGSWRRGPCPFSRDSRNTSGCEARARHVLLTELQALSDAAKNRSAGRRAPPGEPETLFEAQSPRWVDTAAAFRELDFFAQTWGLYASSDFSLQPAGDTPTRRGFYDSWLMGCIPVVSRAASTVYRQIFKGLIYSLAGLAMDDVVVVVPDDVWHDPPRLLATLRDMPREEVALRRRRLGSLAPLVQWGWQADGDALVMFLGSMLTPPSPTRPTVTLDADAESSPEADERLAETGQGLVDANT